MIRMRVTAITKKTEEKIQELLGKIPIADRIKMWATGTSFEVSPDATELTIRLGLINTAAMKPVHDDPKLRKEFENKQALEATQQYTATLKELGLTKGVDYHLEVFKEK